MTTYYICGNGVATIKRERAIASLSDIFYFYFSGFFKKMRVSIIISFITSIFLHFVVAGKPPNSLTQPSLANDEKVLILGRLQFSKAHIQTVATTACTHLKRKVKQQTFPRPSLSGRAKFKASGPYVEFPLGQNNQYWKSGMPFSELLVMNVDCVVVGAISISASKYDMGAAAAQLKGHVNEKQFNRSPTFRPDSNRSPI
ncbi:hypothetical protein K3495_g1058 [Podosphaera aphanis]|nr:hypothetical protein K3495_g1058 [Podosphaera aphanis]